MVAGVHYIHYAYVVYTSLEVNIKYRENSVKFYVLNIYSGGICLCLEISIAVSYLLCIKYFSLISYDQSSMMYGTSDKIYSYLMESVSTLMPINSNSPTRISLLSAVNARFFGCNEQLKKFRAKNMIRNGSDTNTQVNIDKQILPRYIKYLGFNDAVCVYNLLFLWICLHLKVICIGNNLYRQL